MIHDNSCSWILFLHLFFGTFSSTFGADFYLRIDYAVQRDSERVHAAKMLIAWESCITNHARQRIWYVETSGEMQNDFSLRI
ncbi:hypothetical protein BDV59DRAFT_184618 [Aspergillus ambiguus]|uniref:uncharacterized protein n=1 Tax=Aspergillus ambiguus TaxID=176160 RepID=UPI003CCD258E